MANAVEILFSGQDQGLSNTINKIGGAITGIASAIGQGDWLGAATTAFDTLSETVVESISVYTEYAAEVENTMRLTGMSAEETSRMIQVADDMKISTEQLTVAMRFMAKNGMEPNIETLSQLSDEYLALNPGQERAAFLMEKFGRSGLQMGKLMEQGSDKIKEMNASIDENLIMTDEGIAAADKYRLQVDELSDSWQGLQIQLGSQVVPALSDTLDAMKANSQQMEKDKATMSGFAFFMSYPITATTQWMLATEENIVALDSHSEAMRDAEQETRALGDAMSEVAEIDYKNLLSMTQNIYNMNTQYSDQLAELRQKQADLNAEMANTADPEKLAELQVAYDEVGKQVDALTLKHNQATNKMIFDLQAQRLAVDGLDAAEYQMLISMGTALGVIDEDSGESALALNNVSEKVLQLGKDGELTGEQMAAALKLAFEEGQTAADAYIANITGDSGVSATHNDAGESATEAAAKINTAFATTGVNAVKAYIDELGTIPDRIETVLTAETTGQDLQQDRGRTFSPVNEGFGGGSVQSGSVQNIYYYGNVSYAGMDDQSADILQRLR